MKIFKLNSIILEEELVAYNILKKMFYTCFHLYVQQIFREYIHVWWIHATPCEFVSLYFIHHGDILEIKFMYMVCIYTEETEKLFQITCELYLNISFWYSVREKHFTRIDQHDNKIYLTVRVYRKILFIMWNLMRTMWRHCMNVGGKNFKRRNGYDYDMLLS